MITKEGLPPKGVNDTNLPPAPVGANSPMAQQLRRENTEQMMAMAIINTVQRAETGTVLTLLKIGVSPQAVRALLAKASEKGISLEELLEEEGLFCPVRGILTSGAEKSFTDMVKVMQQMFLGVSKPRSATDCLMLAMDTCTDSVMLRNLILQQAIAVNEAFQPGSAADIRAATRAFQDLVILFPPEDGIVCINARLSDLTVVDRTFISLASQISGGDDRIHEAAAKHREMQWHIGIGSDTPELEDAIRAFAALQTPERVRSI